MKQSLAIRRDVEELELRREQLACELSKADQANKDAQMMLVKTGSDESMQSAATAFASFKSLQEAVSLIDQQLAEKEALLAEAIEYEGQATTRARIKELEKGIEAARLEYCQGRERAHNAFHEILLTVVAAHRQHATLWRELKTLLPKNDNVKLTDWIPLEDLGPLSHVVDQGLQTLINLDSRPSKAERKEIMLAQNKRRAEAEARRETERQERERKAAEKGGGFLGVSIRNSLKVA